MKTKNILIIGIIVILAMGIYSISNKQNKNTINLGFSEINEYEGQRLDSVYDFRENSIKGPQNIDIEDYRLKVIGLVEEVKEYTYKDVLEEQSYSKVITLNCVEGWSATILWEGIILRELLSDIQIKESANTIIFHAADGYTTSFPIEYIMEQDKLLAYKMNNETMIPERGFPFQLIAEDKWGYKWIKWITSIEFSNDENYKGYWESRGYSNTGNLDEGFFS